MVISKKALGVGFFLSLCAFSASLFFHQYSPASTAEQLAAATYAPPIPFARDTAQKTAPAALSEDRTEEHSTSPSGEAAEQSPAPDISTPIAIPAQEQQKPPLPGDVVNTRTRAAVVNILCTVTGNDLSPVSGSGVMVDGTGVVLTNAHIGQYVLLQDTSPIAIECFIRTGSPATVTWKPRIMYIPQVWVHEHAKDIMIERPTGTGENDFALLAVEALDEPLTLPLPYLPTNTTEGALITDDTALVASYPAGFAGSLTIYNQLSLTSTIATIGRVFTFGESTIDLISLGGIIIAQEGSSGGAVSNMWGELVGLIVTSSDAETTQGRDLRALTLSHINRVLQSETGMGLDTFIRQRDPRAQASLFRSGTGKLLGAQISNEILRSTGR